MLDTKSAISGDSAKKSAKRIYLAGGLGFSELGRIAFEHFKERLKKALEVHAFGNYVFIDPFEENKVFEAYIGEIQKSRTVEGNVMDIITEINFRIGKRNELLIRNSDIIIANLDGTDVDSGTASEIGFAYALGKKILGYRGDCRQIGDNIGAKVNLQVEYFIKASGGKIVHSIEELAKNIEN